MNNDTLWNEIKEMIDSSELDVQLFDGKKTVGERIVKLLSLNENTSLAKVILNSAGMIVNNCIRILGQGNDNIQSIENVNVVKTGLPTRIEGMLIVGLDIFGGVFAMNTIEIDNSIGDIYYFAPDTLDWESMGVKYSQFLAWALSKNIDEFYQSMQWNGWNEIAKQADFNQAILVYPFLWSKEVNINTATKNIVPFDELFALNMKYRNQFFGIE